METLFSERLILRQWKESDSKDLYEYAKSELVAQMQDGHLTIVKTKVKKLSNYLSKKMIHMLSF